MAWPDFSELTFAFALLRELELSYGPYAGPPQFISQAEEYAKGYDAEVDFGGAIIFLQFKRSEVMTRGTARELASRHFPAVPVFRMHLHRHHDFGQHRALQRLEADGHGVLYAASAVRDRTALSREYLRRRLIDTTGFFAPSEIQLPNVTEAHHVAFQPGNPDCYLYSEEGRSIERRVTESDGLGRFVEAHRRESDENRARLEAFVLRYGGSVPMVADRSDLRSAAISTALHVFDAALVIAK